MKEEVLDVEMNPGHSHIIQAVDFCASSTNYLGREYLGRLGFSRAQDLVPVLEDISQEIVVIDDSLIRVTLFEDPLAFYLPENIDRLWEYRRRLRIDEVAHELLPESAKPSRYVPLSEK